MSPMTTRPNQPSPLNRRRLHVGAAAAGLVLVACAASGPAPSDPPHAAVRDASHAWGYMGPGSPDHWAELSPEFAKCASGHFQSPIDLRPIAKADVDTLSLDYQPDTLRIVNNGHTIQVNHHGDSTLRIGDHPFRLLQYHFHSPSEHTEVGDAHALELHLVHQDDQGHYAVLAVFFDEGPAKDGPDPWHHLPEVPDAMEHQYEGETVDPRDLLPPSLVHYQYHGSLTTPPCSETVTWNVLETPVTMPADRIEQFRHLYAANARPVQPRPTWCLEPHVIGEPE